MIRPYFEDRGITIYLADCRDVLPSIPRCSIDLVVADPPYGVKASVGGMRKTQLRLSTITNDRPEIATTLAYEAIEMAWRALRMWRHAYVFGAFDFSQLKHASAICELIWDKCHIGMGNTRAPWGPQHEYIQFAARARGPLNAARDGNGIARMRRGSVLRHMRQNGGDAKHHIADKPVALLRELIEMSSRHGDLVLDPFSGSGATLVAAVLEGRKAIGIEIDEPWAEVAAKRVQKLSSLPSQEFA